MLTASDKGQQNLRAYDGVENLATFTSKEAIDKYRQERKLFASGAVSFFGKLGIKSPAAVLDIGSGSSCLLYALKDAGILSFGTGIEISTSRHEFAERWKQDGQYREVTNLNENILETDLKSSTFDVCTILDSTFTFFHCVDPQMPLQVLQRVHKSLKSGGWLIIDLTSFVDIVRLCKDYGVYYKWDELPSTNKFRYSLYTIAYSTTDGVACTESRYLYRDRPEEVSKIEHSKVYTAEELKHLVVSAGFKDVSFSGSYTEDAFDPKHSKRIVVTCRT